MIERSSAVVFAIMPSFFNPFIIQNDISVKRPKSRDSHVKTSVLDVSKNEAKKEAVYVRKNKQTDNTFAKVVSNKENVIDVAVANASKAKTLIPKSSETTFIAPKTRFSEKATQSKTLDTTSVASKSKIDEASASKARDKEKDITPKDRKQCKKMTKPDTEWKSCKGQGQSKAKDQISQVKVNSTNQQSKPEP
ncbi:hypothetical protein Tco_1491876 [Tanacetum coccineum]